MAIMSSEEVRGFGQRLDQMVGVVEGELEGLRSKVRNVASSWQDQQAEQFSAQLESLCGSLESFYDEARQYSRNLGQKADLNDQTASHGL